MRDFQQHRTNGFFALLSLPSTAMGFALSIQISALSWILTTQYHLDIHDIGLVWAAGPLAGILGQVIIGVVSDRTWFWNGRRRPFILIGGVLATLMLLALPNLDIISASLGVGGILGVAIAVALTLDLAINVSFNPTRAIIADVTAAGDERTKGYTWMQSISGTFGVLAYAVGAVFDNYVLIYSGALLVLLFSVIPPLFISEPRELAPEDTTQAGPADRRQDSFIGMLIAIPTSTRWAAAWRALRRTTTTPRSPALSSPSAWWPRRCWSARTARGWRRSARSSRPTRSAGSVSRPPSCSCSPFCSSRCRTCRISTWAASAPPPSWY